MVECINIILPEICLFLKIEEVLTVIAFVIKDWKELILNESFISFWIKKFFNIQESLTFSKLKSIYLNHKRNSVLDFEGWKTDERLSELEITNSYSNLWTYNANPYSSFCKRFYPTPLKRNINCLASFKGGYQDKDDFFRSWHCDVYRLSYGTSSLQRIYNSDYVIHKCLTIDPLRIQQFNDFRIFSFASKYYSLNNSLQSFNSPPHFEIHPAAAPALVSKVAIARPAFYTGGVKTLMIIVTKTWGKLEFEDFQTFDNILNIEAARCVAKVKKEQIDSEFHIVEYERGEDWVYPLVWVEFNDYRCNHLEYQLSQAHYVSLVNAKFYDIHDRRHELDMLSYQPNFDVMYVVMIGTDMSLD